MQGRVIYGREERRGEDLSYNKEIDAFFLWETEFGIPQPPSCYIAVISGQ
jgi:hypothetical protein